MGEGAMFAYVVAGVDLGAVLAEDLDAFAPSVVRGVVQGSVARSLHLIDVLPFLNELLHEIQVAIEHRAVQEHLTHRAAAAHGSAAVILDTDASVLLGKGTLDAGVPRVALDHRVVRVCSCCGDRGGRGAEGREGERSGVTKVVGGTKRQILM